MELSDELFEIGTPLTTGMVAAPFGPLPLCGAELGGEGEGEGEGQAAAIVRLSASGTAPGSAPPCSGSTATTGLAGKG